jgi:hypothetical protein
MLVVEPTAGVTRVINRNPRLFDERDGSRHDLLPAHRHPIT